MSLSNPSLKDIIIGNDLFIVVNGVLYTPNDYDIFLNGLQFFPKHAKAEIYFNNSELENAVCLSKGNMWRVTLQKNDWRLSSAQTEFYLNLKVLSDFTLE